MITVGECLEAGQYYPTLSIRIGESISKLFLVLKTSVVNVFIYGKPSSGQARIVETNLILQLYPNEEHFHNSFFYFKCFNCSPNLGITFMKVQVTEEHSRSRSVNRSSHQSKPVHPRGDQD